jgi:hypothetical protein
MVERAAPGGEGYAIDHFSSKAASNYFKKFDNISFLNNTYEYYEKYCFIGTTLWSKIINSNYEINDVYRIPNFDYIICNRLNMINVDFHSIFIINLKFLHLISLKIF